MAVTVGLLGDVMLGRGVAERLHSIPPADVWAPEVRELLCACDAVIVNLECCISDRGHPTRRVRGKPFFFRAPPAAVESLRAIGVSAVSLANNHALDYEEEALADTLTCLRAGGIAFTGAGEGRERARAPTTVDAGGRRLGVVAVTDHPREYEAGRRSRGVAWAQLRERTPDWVLDAIGELRETCDLVVAFPHWGPNMSTRPARWQHDRARDLLAAGADLVAGHSAHVFHGVGGCDGRPVLYDLGDALDDYARDRFKRNDLGIAALWRPDSELQIELVALRLDFAHTSLARGSDADWVAERLRTACEELGTTVRRLDEQRFAVEGPG
jgi:poly-gamma-glutamate synthesis protein (capsule biosynthesis protein)